MNINKLRYDKGKLHQVENQKAEQFFSGDGGHFPTPSLALDFFCKFSSDIDILKIS